MILSTAGTQLIVILTIPILTRLFNPDIFGYHSTYRSILVILAILMTLKLETALVLSKSILRSTNIFLTTLTNISLVSVFSLVIYFVLKLIGIDLLEMTFGFSSFFLLFIVVAGAILVALSNVSQNVLVSQNNFKSISLSKLIVPVFFFLISLLFFLIFDTVLSLIIAHFLAYVLLNIYLKSRYKMNFSKFSSFIYKSTLIKYKEIVAFTSSNSLLNSVSTNLPAILLLGFYGATPLGFYAIGSKIIALPSQLVSASLSQVFYKKFVDIYNSDKTRLFQFVKNTYIKFLTLGLIIFGIIYFIIPFIIPFFLGDEWIEAIPIIKYLCFWQALVIANSPMSTLTILLSKQKQLLVYQASLLLGRFLALWVPFSLGLSFNNAILVYALVGLFFNFILMLFLLHISKQGK